MAQHNSSQTLHQQQGQQQQQQQQSPQQQQQPQQNGVTQLPQVAVASQQNNNLTANYPHHYQMPGGSVFVPTQSPHGGALYSVMPAPLPGNVFVNNVTANVNLHGAWATHPTYIPAGQTYIPATGEMPPNVASIEPIMQPIVNQQNNNTIPRNSNRRNRNNSNPRNNSVNRRNDYNQRPHLNSPIPQDIANANSLDANNQTLNQGYHHPYGYPQFACQPPQFFNHVSPQQVSHSQAQQATGAPLYLTSMYPGPFFNYPVLISPATPAHMLPQAPPSQEYQLGDERNSENVVDQHGQPIHINVPGGTMMQPQLWNPHEIPIEYQEEYHVIGNEGTEDINHNTAVSITDSDTPSMMSPSGYSIHYDPNLQLIEAQQHMNSLQIYDQHGAPNEEDIHQQQIIQDQQPEHYPQMHDQVVMISHEVNVYDPESICERPEVHQDMNPVLQHIDSQNPYNQYQQQTHILEQEECYSDLQYENNSPEKLEYQNVENIDFNQNVPNIQEENGIIQENANCAQELNLSTNSNESDASFEQNCEQIPLNVGNNIVIISEENSSQFLPTNEYHSSSESTKSGENIIQHNIPTHIPVIHPQPQIQIANPAVLLPYQPLLPNQILPQQSVEIQNNQISSAQVKSTVYNPTQITKKTTASVAVTATPIQHNIITHVGMSNNPIVPTVKAEISNTILLPKTNAILQIPTNNVSQISGALPQRERKHPVVQVEQKSIASTAVPHQIQENNYQSNICNTNEVKKQEPNLTDHNAKKIEKKDELTNTLNVNKEIDLKTPISTAHQPPAGPKSWASLFTPKQPSNNTVPTNNNNSSLVNNTNLSNNVNKKPVAKVLPFEGTVNLQSNLNPGALSYSAASAQGISTNKITPSLTIPNMPSNVAVVHSNGSVKNGKPSLIQNIASSGDNSDEWTIKYADFLKKYKTDFSPISLKPRGLKNPNNYCFINAVLQALIGCSPLYNLLKSAPKQSAALHLDKSKIPTINAMTQLISDFNTLPFGVRLMNRRDRTQKQNQKQSINNDELVGELQTDSAFEASPIYKLWNSSRPDVDEGRQGDAEEFLSYVLNKLNDEMLEVIKLMSKPPPTQVPVQQNGSTFGEGDEGGGDDWQMIYNNRNKGSVTRQTDFGKTPISDIFRGELRSRLQREGEHSTDVIQPFFTLQLNIEKAGSVREALEILVGRDQLEGVTCSKTNQEVVAWQQMNLEKLPLILIVHLKFFDYKSDGCTKIVKQFEFPLELKIDTKILASKKYSAKQKLYRLFAVVYHDGKEAVKGHYISDVYHSGYSNWLRYDDANVKPISESSVLRPRGLRVPYLLFYRRCDTIATTSTSTTSTPQQQQQQQHGLTHSK